MKKNDKCCTNKLQIVREIPWNEVLKLCNTGNGNTGNGNTGNGNTGNCNTGNCNTGNCNTGNGNTGNRNTGNCNTGDWNMTSYETGCFNTKKAYINLFNRPSTWTYDTWQHSIAYDILNTMPQNYLEWIDANYMTDNEKINYPEYKTTGGFLKKIDAVDRQNWWDSLPEGLKQIIKSIPNFDRNIFKEVTGIMIEEDINMEESK